jgi:hypothetical protein
MQTAWRDEFRFGCAMPDGECRRTMMRLMMGATMGMMLMAATANAQAADPMAGHHGRMMMHGHPMGSMGMEEATPTLLGQDAFGAVQEIVRILEADPDTDWSKVNLDALREHLIDMNEVTLHADAAVEPVEGGIRVAVTGTGRTLAAIRRMVPAHAREIDGQKNWHSRTESLPDGVMLIVTTDDAKQVAIIRGLRFMGVLASGTHHRMHHLMMAKGDFHP